jgi:hypothetical protein
MVRAVRGKSGMTAGLLPLPTMRSVRFVPLHVVGEAIDQDEGADPFGMGQQEMARLRDGYTRTDHGCLPEAHGVEHGVEVSVENLLHKEVPGVSL